MERNIRPKGRPFPFGRFLAWKSSDITSAGVFIIVTTYMSLFCTDHLGMSPMVVGNIILVSNVIDFFTDLIAAYVIDNTKTKWGKARPYELGAVGMTLCTTLIFITPNGWTDTLKIVWVFCVGGAGYVELIGPTVQCQIHAVIVLFLQQKGIFST